MRPIFALLLTTPFALADDIAQKGGQPTPVPGTDHSITFAGLTDHRCPAHVDCYWDGTMQRELDVVQNATVTPFALCNLCDGATRAADVAGQRITFVSRAPSTKDLALLGRAPRISDDTAMLTITPP